MLLPYYYFRVKSIPVLFENDEILIINKPSKVAVQGGKDIAHPLDKELSTQLGYPIYLVHRLDRDTSGLMIVAKSPLYAAVWTKKIASKEVVKEYSAICIGKFSQKNGIITTNIVQHGSEKAAQTYYEVVEEKEFLFDEKKDSESEKIVLSSVRLRLQTGRMHQIRIHLASINCPIAGDDKHGNFKLNKIVRKLCGIKNLKLCAYRLTVPIDGKRKTFEVEPLSLLFT